MLYWYDEMKVKFLCGWGWDVNVPAAYINYYTHSPAARLYVEVECVYIYFIAIYLCTYIYNNEYPKASYEDIPTYTHIVYINVHPYI